MTVRAKHFEYWITLDDSGLTADGQPMSLVDASAEHLLLSALARCSISSLEYFARQRGLEAQASAFASGTVTWREEDDRYGFAEIDCRMEVALAGDVDDGGLRALLESAEWGCFVGASLGPPPRYRWRVNGRNL